MNTAIQLNNSTRDSVNIGGGRGQWLGGHHGECRAQGYNGGLGAEPLVRGSGGLTAKVCWSLDVQRSRQI